jgi:hypothetical protein
MACAECDLLKATAARFGRSHEEKMKELRLRLRLRAGTALISEYEQMWGAVNDALRNLEAASAELERHRKGHQKIQKPLPFTAGTRPSR